ncbi:MAG: 5-formyltetrahydrofolate cyclo-ligase [Actinomycetota bacterium]
MDSRKIELRKRFREEREFHHEAIDSKDLRWQHLTSAREFLTASVIASYISYGTEPETRYLNEEVLNQHKVLLIPRLTANRDLEWVQWNGSDATLKLNGRHFEADGASYSGPIDLVMVPALHVDRHGNRLGQGGGSYDRALATISGWKVALVYAGELTSEEIPVEPHDQPVDAVATPELLVRFTKQS